MPTFEEDCFEQTGIRLLPLEVFQSYAKLKGYRMLVVCTHFHQYRYTHSHFIDYAAQLQDADQPTIDRWLAVVRELAPRHNIEWNEEWDKSTRKVVPEPPKSSNWDFIGAMLGGLFSWLLS